MGGSIAHYDILGTIGNGPLGPVYRARDTKVGRTVAVRVLTGGMDDPAQRARALDLVQPYTALTHPHVATLFEVGEQRGSIYLVYEFVPGVKLNALLAGQPMNVRRALDLAAQMADALADAHALRLVHGSLTASSVIITPKGHAKILDFGLLAGVPDDGRKAGGDIRALEQQAARLEVLGRSRVAYSAPEQLLGQAPDHRADLFALGALLHEMLTGKHAFSGSSAADVGAHILQWRPPMPTTLNPGLPRAVDSIVSTALAKKPEERYQDAVLLAADIREVAAAAHGEAAELDQAAPTARRSGWRIAMLLALLLAAAALGLWQWQEPLRQDWRGRFGAQPAPRFVVMPFQVATADPSRPYYGAGFAEDLARRLGQIPGVTVLGRSTIRAMAGKTPQAAAAEAGAAIAVTGTLTPADDEWTALRVDVRLVDRGADRVIWSRTQTSSAQDLMALQARITFDVAAWLRIAYKPTAANDRAALRLVNPSSYDKYLQAREAMADHDASRAAQLFEAAAAEDPSLVEAQSGLAEALYMASAFEGREHFGDVWPRARQAAEAAYSADPEAATARLAMGLTAPTSREALEQLRRALEIDASYATAFLAIADVMRPFDPAGAARYAQRAAALDPSQPLVYYQLAADHVTGGDFAGAFLALGRGQALASSLPWWDAIRERVGLARKSVPSGSRTLDARDAGDFPPGIILRAAALATSNRANDAAALLGSLSRLYPGSCETRAMMAAVYFRGSRPAEGMRIANEIAAKAASAPEGSGWSRCAVMAAAAVNDPSRAAAALSRMAASESEMRAWGAVNAVLDGRAALRQAVFPWSAVAESPDVARAMKSVDASAARARAEAARTLAGM